MHDARKIARAYLETSPEILDAIRDVATNDGLSIIDRGSNSGRVLLEPTDGEFAVVLDVAKDNALQRSDTFTLKWCNKVVFSQ